MNTEHDSIIRPTDLSTVHPSIAFYAPVTPDNEPRLAFILVLDATPYGSFHNIPTMENDEPMATYRKSWLSTVNTALQSFNLAAAVTTGYAGTDGTDSRLWVFYEGVYVERGKDVRNWSHFRLDDLNGMSDGWGLERITRGTVTRRKAHAKMVLGQGHPLA